MKAKTLKDPGSAFLEKTAVLAAHAAGRALMKHFRKKLLIREKPGAGIVTNADLAAETAAFAVLKARTPSFSILSEEAGARPASESGLWIIDPLDGTTNYAHGFESFCVSIAAQWNGQTRVGVIYHPVLDETYVAVRGKGARVNGHRMHVSGVARIRDSLLTTGFTYRKDQWLAAEMVAFERLSAVAQAIRRPGSAALDLAYVARGVFDGFWERRLAPWDVAAGALLVSEAGGKVTDFKGKAFSPGGPELLASNAKLHRELLKAVS